jgi:hypothetical protein
MGYCNMAYEEHITGVNFGLLTKKLFFVLGDAITLSCPLEAKYALSNCYSCTVYLDKLSILSKQ